jgi:ParB family chromosome partitioning protein
MQPRRYFDEESLSHLAASISSLGLLQPILVRRFADQEYQIIAGERRWRAARRAGLDMIPALVQDADDLSSLEQAVVENLHREDLNPLEEAGAYRQLIDDFGLTHDQLAQRMGKSRTAITNSLRLFQLPQRIQEYLAEGSITAGHARAILGSSDRNFQ